MIRLIKLLCALLSISILWVSQSAYAQTNLNPEIENHLIYIPFMQLADPAPKIAFLANNHPDIAGLDIFTMHPDGSEVKNLTNSLESEGSIAWSPDGTKIAFKSEREGKPGIFVMRADGSGLARLAEVGEGGTEIRGWFPDGKKILYEKTVCDDRCTTKTHEIFVIDLDGNQPVRLVDSSYAWNPILSPDGRQIAFSMRIKPHPPYNSQIYVMNTNGTGLKWLTNYTDTASKRLMDWSPDGKVFLFSLDPEGPGGPYLYTMRPDGTDFTQLTQLPAGIYLRDAVWSQDGQKIVFIADPDGEEAIYILNLDDLSISRLTNISSHISSFTLSPDGSQIAFNASQEEVHNLFVVDSDGSDLRQLTQNSSKDIRLGDPVWQP